MLAVETGADAIGMIFAPSVRRITESAAKHIAEELPPFITPVGVFVNPSRDDIARARSIFPDLVVQLHGNEPASFVSSVDGKVMKAIHVDPNAADPAALERAANDHPRAILLFDTMLEAKTESNSPRFPWKAIAPVAKRRQVIVGGGLTPQTVAQCIQAVRPYGVDVRRGIETDGRKDRAKMRAFVKAVKDADAA